MTKRRRACNTRRPEIHSPYGHPVGKAALISASCILSPGDRWATSLLSIRSEKPSQRSRSSCARRFTRLATVASRPVLHLAHRASRRGVHCRSVGRASNRIALSECLYGSLRAVLWKASRARRSRGFYIPAGAGSFRPGSTPSPSALHDGFHPSRSRPSCTTAAFTAISGELHGPWCSTATKRRLLPSVACDHA